jgi:hypothetical protein
MFLHIGGGRIFTNAFNAFTWLDSNNSPPLAKGNFPLINLGFAAKPATSLQNSNFSFGRDVVIISAPLSLV